MMKKRLCRLFILAAAVIMQGCGDPAQTDNTEQTSAETTASESFSSASASSTENTVSETENDNSEQIILTTPIVFSVCKFNGIYPYLFGKNLIMEMTDGAYNYQNSYWGRAWEGSFRFRLTESGESSFYEETADDIISGSFDFNFNQQFDICADDYNNDGCLDFTVNQFGSLSGGSDCSLFSLNSDGEIIQKKIRVGNKLYDTLRLPKEYNSNYSPKFEKEGQNCFSVSYFTSGGAAENEIPLISHDIIENWFYNHNDSVMSEFTLKNIYKWGDEFVVLKEQQILEADGNIWYSSETEQDYPQLTALADYILNDLQNELSFLPKEKVGIILTDFNKDGNTDAFVMTEQQGLNYFMIDNINTPKHIYNFFAFDNADFLYDIKTDRFVIKYEKHYGLFTYATSEINFIFVGDEITETEHIHFTGTSGPEEFYIVDENGEKTVCGEDDIAASIAEIEKNLQPYDGDTEHFTMTVSDSGFTIEKLNS